MYSEIHMFFFCDLVGFYFLLPITVLFSFQLPPTFGPLGYDFQVRRPYALRPTPPSSERPESVWDTFGYPVFLSQLPSDRCRGLDQSHLRSSSGGLWFCEATRAMPCEAMLCGWVLHCFWQCFALSCALKNKLLDYYSCKPVSMCCFSATSQGKTVHAVNQYISLRWQLHSNAFIFDPKKANCLILFTYMR